MIYGISESRSIGNSCVAHDDSLGLWYTVSIPKPGFGKNNYSWLMLVVYLNQDQHQNSGRKAILQIKPCWKTSLIKGLGFWDSQCLSVRKSYVYIYIYIYICVKYYKDMYIIYIYMYSPIYISIHTCHVYNWYCCLLVYP